MPKNDWTKTTTVAGVTFTPASDGATCERRLSGYSCRNGSNPKCGKKAVTTVTGFYSYRNGNQCAVHAAGVKRAADNEVRRTADYEARTERYRSQAARNEAAQERIKAHGIDFGYNPLSWTDVADWLDKVAADTALSAAVNTEETS